MKLDESTTSGLFTSSFFIISEYNCKRSDFNFSDASSRSFCGSYSVTIASLVTSDVGDWKTKSSNISSIWACEMSALLFATTGIEKEREDFGGGGIEAKDDLDVGKVKSEYEYSTIASCDPVSK